MSSLGAGHHSQDDQESRSGNSASNTSLEQRSVVLNDPQRPAPSQGRTQASKKRKGKKRQDLTEHEPSEEENNDEDDNGQELETGSALVSLVPRTPAI